MKDLPLVMNNAHNNQINYPCQKLNFNMICCPQIPPVNQQVQKQSFDKTNNSSNFLPEINHKDNSKSVNQEKLKLIIITIIITHIQIIIYVLLLVKTIMKLK